MRVSVTAERPIDELVIGIEESLWEDMTVNTMIPAASDEASEDGEFALHVRGAAGRHVVPVQGRHPGQPRHHRRQRRHDHRVRR